MSESTNNPAETVTGAMQAFENAYAALLNRQHASNRGAGTTAWLKPVRDRAMRAFSRRGFPTTRDEDWKYTNLDDVAARSAAFLERDIARADGGTPSTTSRAWTVIPRARCSNPCARVVANQSSTREEW